MPHWVASCLELKKFVAPEFIFGLGARRLAARYAQNYGARKVLLVTDQTLYAATPWVQEMLGMLSAADLPCAVFDKVSPNPRSAEIMAGSRLYAREGCNAIIALGGGSVIDCAKGIGIVAANGGSILDYEGVDRIIHPMPPLICIPTTSGSASEVSQFCIVLDEQRRTKVAIVSKAVVPDVGLVDPETTVTMDAWLTACTGMDALTHAIEAYVSNASSPITDLHALEAIRIIWDTLPAAIANPQDIVCRGQLLFGSLQAGLAFSNAILGAVHAMAHSLGGYFDLPHGVCNAVLLGPVSASNYFASPDRYGTIGRIIGIDQPLSTPVAAAAAFSEAIERFRRTVGIGCTLRDLGVDRNVLPALAAFAYRDSCLTTNPRLLTEQELEGIYEAAF